MRLSLLLLLAGCAAEVEVSIGPDAPRTGDTLIAVTSVPDPEIWWYRDDQFITSSPELAPGWTRKGERWRADLHQGPRVVSSETVQIQNTPPEVTLRLLPEMHAGTDVQPSLTVTDADGDPLTWSAVWSHDGWAVDSTLGLAGWRTVPGERWSLLVAANDGEETVLVSRSVDIIAPPLTREPGARLLDEGFVHRVDVLLSDAGVEALADAPTAWVAADVLLDGVPLEQVGVRLKGNGSFDSIDGKPSFLLNFDQFVEGQAYDGLDELVLNNGALDPSQLHERLAYELYRSEGVPAPRAVHAEVTIAGLHRGLYTLVEAVDGRFLDRWFADGDGPLYEMYDVDFTPDQIVSFDHDGGADDRDPLERVATALQDPATRLSELDPLIDVDAFVNYLAVSAAIGQFDAYPWSRPGDDLYVYVDPSDGRLRFIAHGADETFSDPWRPVDHLYGALGQACLDDPVCRGKWVARVHEVGATLALVRSVDVISEQIMPALERDIWRRGTVNDVVSAWYDVRDFLVERSTRLAEMPGLR